MHCWHSSTLWNICNTLALVKYACEIIMLKTMCQSGNILEPLNLLFSSHNFQVNTYCNINTREGGWSGCNISDISHFPLKLICYCRKGQKKHEKYADDLFLSNTLIVQAIWMGPLLPTISTLRTWLFSRASRAGWVMSVFCRKQEWSQESSIFSVIHWRLGFIHWLGFIGFISYILVINHNAYDQLQIGSMYINYVYVENWS